MSQDFYKIPNLKAERDPRAARHARACTGAASARATTSSSARSFLDEVALAKGVDPLDYRLDLTKDHPRAQAVIKAVAEMSNYKREAQGPRRIAIAYLGLPTADRGRRRRSRSTRRPARSRSTTTGSRSIRASWYAARERPGPGRSAIVVRARPVPLSEERR